MRDLTNLTPDTFEFCSHKFQRNTVTDTWSASLLSWPKALYTILSKKITGEQLAGFCYELRNNDNKEELIEFVLENGTFSKDA